MNRKAAILVTILLVTACGGRDALLRRKQTAPEPVTVKVMTAVKSAAGVSAGFVGTVQSDLDATLRSPADGTVKQLSAREGHPVKKGQVLAVIESETLKSAGGPPRPPWTRPKTAGKGFPWCMKAARSQKSNT